MQLRASRTVIDQVALHLARISHTGADMHFLRLGGGGMRARIEQADAPEHLSIQHLGEMRDGAQADLADWVGVYERYRLHPLADGGTRLEVELLKMPEECAPMMNDMWPRALDQLRQICVSWPPRLIPS